MSVCFLLGGGAVYICRILTHTCELSHADLEIISPPLWGLCGSEQTLTRSFHFPWKQMCCLWRRGWGRGWRHHWEMGPVEGLREWGAAIPWRGVTCEDLAAGEG